jgi:hypothetical protein
MARARRDLDPYMRNCYLKLPQGPGNRIYLICGAPLSENFWVRTNSKESENRLTTYQKVCENNSPTKIQLIELPEAGNCCSDFVLTSFQRDLNAPVLPSAFTPNP